MSAAPRRLQLADDGTIPNSPLPLLHYPQAMHPDAGAAAFEALFAGHGWGQSWRNGIFDFRGRAREKGAPPGAYTPRSTPICSWSTV